jgi:hypothetical protein
VAHAEGAALLSPERRAASFKRRGEQRAAARIEQRLLAGTQVDGHDVGHAGFAGFLNGEGFEDGLPPLGPDAHVTERFALVEPDVLEIRSTLVAPALLAAPFEITTRYTRLRDHEPLERDECARRQDRLIDPASGATRFELAPPADLPPPPRQSRKKS